MISLCSLFKSFGSTCSIRCIAISLPAMALSDWKFLSDDDPWKMSAFVSAIMELFLSILLLLGTSITFFTSRIVKIFDLEPPCTYIGCSHRFLSQTEVSQERALVKDYPVIQNGDDGDGVHLQSVVDHQSSCSNRFLTKRRLRSKRLQLGVFRHAYYTGKLLKVHPALSSARSRLESNGGVDAKDHIEILHVSANSEQEWECRKTNKSDEDIFSHDVHTVVEDVTRVHANTAESSEELLYQISKSDCQKEGACYRRNDDTRFVHRSEPCKEHTWVEDTTQVHPYEISQAHSTESLSELLNKTSMHVCEHKEAHKERDGIYDCIPASGHCSEASEGYALVEDTSQVHALELLDRISSTVCDQIASCNERHQDLDDHATALVQRSEAFKGHTSVEVATELYSSGCKETLVEKSSSSVLLNKISTAVCEQEGTREEVHWRDGVYGDDTALGHYCKAVNGHDFKKADNANSLEPVNKISNVYNKEQPTMGLLPLQDNHCYIMFGSIIAFLESELASNSCVGTDRLDDSILGIVDTGGEGNLQEICVKHCSNDKSSEILEDFPSDSVCLRKGTVATPLLELRKPNVNTKDTILLESANASSAKDWIILECNQGDLFVQDPVCGVEDGVGDANATRESHVEPMERNAIIPQTMKSLSANILEGPTFMEEKSFLGTLFQDDDGEEDAIATDEEEESLDALKKALQAERSLLAVLEEELENERNAAAVATSEAMAMISRLQEEKSAMQMEVAQLHRMSEERANYDEQAMAVLKEILFKREAENMALEKEVEVCREKLFAGKGSEPNEAWFKGASGNLVIEPRCNPLLLTNEEVELWSPLGQQLSTSSERLYRLGNWVTPWTPRSAPDIEVEELNAVPFHLNTNKNKRSRVFPAGDKVVASVCGLCDDKRSRMNCVEGCLHSLPCENYQQGMEMGRCLSSTDDERSLAQECLWMPEGKLHESRGQEDSKSEHLWTTEVDKGQHSAFSLAKRRAIHTESYSLKFKSSINGDGLGEVDGGCGGSVPVHDVYEVHSSSNRSPPRTEEREPVEVFDAISTSTELQPRALRDMIEIPPKLLPVTKPNVTVEFPGTPSSMEQTAIWDIEKSVNPDIVSDCHALQLQSFVPREDQLTQIQQLALRLKALEDDRDLLRETMDSYKHRDTELTLLKEIAQHLRDLRMAGSTGVCRGLQFEETAVTSPRRSHALKKRRYSSGPGQAHTLLQPKKSAISN